MAKEVESKKTITVWMIQHVFHPLWAGPAERFLRYSPGLKDRNVNLGFVTVQRKGLERFEVHRGADVYRIGPEIDSVKRWKMFTMHAILMAIKKRIDVLYIFALHPVHIPFLYLLNALGIKTLYINTMARSVDIVNPTFRVRLSQAFHLRVLNLVSSIVFSTKEHSAYLEKIGFKKMDKVEIIPNGVNTDRFKPAQSVEEKRQIRNELKLPTEDLIFLYVGLRIPRKGVLELVKGWREYKMQGNQGVLVLVGRDQKELDDLKGFYEEWEQVTNELKDEMGLIIREPSSEVEKYFKASDVFTFLSKHEGMPNVLLEAMSSGMAVLTTKFDGFSEAFGQSGNELLITTHDINDIKRDLIRLSDNNEIRQLGEQARKWIIETQKLELVLDRYVDVTRNVINRDT